MELNQDRQDVEGGEEDQHEQPVLWLALLKPGLPPNHLICLLDLPRLKEPQLRHGVQTLRWSVVVVMFRLT